MAKPSAPIILWAIEIRSSRSWWINYLTIKRTKKDAIAAYKAEFADPQFAETAWAERYQRGDVRPTRVFVEATRP